MRGLGAGLAKEVARQLMEKDALGAHVRDELGISPHLKARPLQAAFTSAAVALIPEKHLIPYVAGVSLVFLLALGSIAAKAGGAPIATGALRVTFTAALCALAGSLLTDVDTNAGRRHPFSAARVTVPEAPASVMGPSSRDRAPGSSNKAVWASPEHVASGFVERAFRSSPAFRPSAAFRPSVECLPSAVSPME